MNCIIFFIILISLIYLNYNLKFTENFKSSTTQASTTQASTTQASTTQAITIPEKFIDENQLVMAKLHNISYRNQNLKPYLDMSDKQGTCISNNDCEGNHVCHIKKENCNGCELNKCYKIIDTNMYYLDNSNQDKPSYIEVFDIDSFNVTFKFRVILSHDNNNQMIVQSGTNDWYIYIDSDKNIMLNSKQLHSIKNDEENIYTFTVKVTNDYINVDIDGSEETIALNISDSDSVEYKKIYFGASINNPQDINYFNGNIGGFFFEDENNKICTFKYNKEGIKTECLTECEKDGCNAVDCDDICKDHKICNFDSSKNVSRHAIDCMTKCIHPDNSCDINYCKKQCWNCGPECYWIKNNKFSEEYDDKTGKPYPAKISLHSTSYDGTKAKIVWEPPNEGKNNLPIDGYFLIAYKTKKKSEGLKIDKIDSGICEKYCNYVVSNLIPEEDYSLVVRAYNAMGIGRASNLLPVKTTKKLINTDVLNKIEDVNQYEIGHYSNDNFCNI